MEMQPKLQYETKNNNKNGTTIYFTLMLAKLQYQHLANNMGKTPLYVALEKRHSRDGVSFAFIDKIAAYFQLSNNSSGSSYDPTLEAILDICTTPGIEGPHGETVLHATARRDNTSGVFQTFQKNKTSMDLPLSIMQLILTVPRLLNCC
ncbi:hypothetical protein Leryth_001369 [Lithospermum erythrorhizon]|nr:hypothetical protein Leryth_001369 [Lithospermum erythrorhizon]